ncbi:hypothetical protein VNO78_27101 [Psophocarpus tetragonolobus]|uniref:Uncharacterized protein n=1 Tax=Psophocarpus tetragonolobus TaxID=3891 RepID=A0AAN9S116_PSOTE
MGLTEKAQIEGAFDSDNNSNNTNTRSKWAIAGIALRTPLKPIFTSVPVEKEQNKDEVVESEEYCSTTPTNEESKIPTPFTCPPAPRKRKPSFKCCNYGAVVGDFFTPPDLESVFISHGSQLIKRRKNLLSTHFHL